MGKSNDVGKRPRWRGIAKRIVVVVVACTVVPTALLVIFQDKFVYETSSPMLPIERYLPDGRDISYRASDGTKLAGWFVASRVAASSCGRAPTAIVFHGQGGNRSTEYKLINALADLGANVLSAEYRGYGGTEGTPSEEGLAADARAAVDAVKQQPEVDGDRLIYVGFSLGTGVAVRLASEIPPRGVLLLAPYTSLPDIAWTRMPGLPYHLLMRNQFDSLARIRAVTAPVMIVVGTADDTVPNEQSRLLWGAVANKADYLELAGMGHMEVDWRSGRQLRDHIEPFVTHTAGC